MSTFNYKNIAYMNRNNKKLGDFQENTDDTKKELIDLIDDIHEYIADKHQDLIDEILKGKKDKVVLASIIDDFISQSEKGQGLTQKNITQKLVDEIVGWERLQPLMDDPAITNIFTNEDLEVIKRVRGEDVLTNIKFDTDEELEQFIKNISIRTGEKINRDKCIMDGFDRISNIRINAGIYGSPVRKGEVVQKPYIAIRKYIANDFKAQEFINNETFNESILKFYKEVAEDATIAIVGEPDAGKTTHLDFIQSLKDPMRRTINIQEEPELSSRNKNSVSFVARKMQGEEKRVKYDLAEFAKNATRLAGKEVAIAEIRDRAAWYLYRLIDMGYNGIYSVHGNNCLGGLEQTQFLMSLENNNMTYTQLMKKICDSVDFVVYISHRKVIDIAEVKDYNKEKEETNLNYIFRLQVNEDGEFYWKEGEISKKFKEKLQLKNKLKERRV